MKIRVMLGERSKKVENLLNSHFFILNSLKLRIIQ